MSGAETTAGSMPTRRAKNGRADPATVAQRQMVTRVAETTRARSRFQTSATGTNTDFFDYDAFLADFEAGLPAADLNADGFLDLFDYADFVASFEAGC